jgi:hypothetical protein
MLAWMIISLYISASSSQPLKNNQNDSDSAEEIEQWSFKEKRPFCNAFAGAVFLKYGYEGKRYNLAESCSFLARLA